MTKIISRIYRISFVNQGNIYELYARKVNHGDLFGFVELSEIVFGATAGMVVDPAEEKLKNEFAGVKSTFIPMHSILRIDEVEKEGVAKIREVNPKTTNNISYFPLPVTPPNDQ